MAAASPFSIQRLSLKDRNYTLGDHIKTSEVFPRIRDAEASMAEDEKDFHKRIQKKKDKKKKSLKSGVKLPAIPSPVKHKGTQQDYFSEFVVNKDTSCSKYMPFDKVYFPKLFTNSTASKAPNSIDMVWMLGFTHYAEHRPIIGRPEFG
ncbi:hypothetical protein EON65_15315 [archaeon]|nr:MAG: hypothetical protein EON65_15315 [archaeon]